MQEKTENKIGYKLKNYKYEKIQQKQKRLRGKY